VRAVASAGTPLSIAATVTASALVNWSRCVVIKWLSFRAGGGTAGRPRAAFLSAPTPGRPFGHQPKTTLEAASPQATPEFGTIVATRIPLSAELDEVSLQRV
jgi:hypothetical protein